MWQKKFRKGDVAKVTKNGYDKGLRVVIVESNTKTVLVNTGDCLKAFQVNELTKVRRGRG